MTNNLMHFIIGLLAAFTLGFASFGFYLIICLLILDFILNKYDMGEIVEFVKKETTEAEEELPDEWKI